MAPSPSSSAGGPEEAASADLKAPIIVVAPNGQWEHEQGELIIGRGESSGIVIDDPLISRCHAKIRVGDDGVVVVEDLNSTNGTYLNGSRMTRATSRLRDGDRLLLGTTELSVFASRPSTRTPSLRQRVCVIGLVQRPESECARPSGSPAFQKTLIEEETLQQMPSGLPKPGHAGPSTLPRMSTASRCEPNEDFRPPPSVPSSRQPPRQSPSRAAPPPGAPGSSFAVSGSATTTDNCLERPQDAQDVPESGVVTGHGRDRHSDGHLSNGPLPQPTTERSDTVELVGRLADRLLASGKIPDAVRVLSEHLRNLLGGASAGLPVPENVLALATRYALRLYEWTHRTEWIDYVFRLHLTCRHLPSTAALDALEPVCMAQMDFDRRAVEYLVHALSAPAASTSPDRAARLARLAQLARIPQPR